MSTLIVGCGYLGRRVALRMMDAGHRVFATTRSRDRAEDLAALGIEPVIADVLHGDTLSGFPAVERAFYCVGYDRSAGVPMDLVYVDGLRRVLGRLATLAKRLVYASSTGVYGDHGGEWVDERTPTGPMTDSGRVCLAAEEALRGFAAGYGYPVKILRYAGLYGPARLMRREALLAGRPIASDPEAYLNLVHVDDAARVAVAALSASKPGPLYCVADDRPVRRGAFYEQLARALGAPSPSFATPGGDGPVRGDADKRVSNRLVKGSFGLTLEHPDIATGIPASLAAERAGEPEASTAGRP